MEQMLLVGGGGAGDGFLPFDAMTRGIGLGFSSNNFIIYCIFYG